MPINLTNYMKSKNFMDTQTTEANSRKKMIIQIVLYLLKKLNL